MRHPTGDNEAVEAEAPEASCLDEEPEDDGKEELHPRPTEGKTLRIQVPPDDCSSPRASGGSPEEKPKGQRYQNDPKEGYRKRSSASLLGSAKHEAIPHQVPLLPQPF